MVCTPGRFRPFNAPGVQVIMLHGDEPDALLIAGMQIQHESFAVSNEPPPSAEFERVRERIRAGTLQSALAFLDGVPAGAGNMIPIAGVAELGGVATGPAFRRRGVAATLSSFMTEQLFGAGGAAVKPMVIAVLGDIKGSSPPSVADKEHATEV